MNTLYVTIRLPHRVDVAISPFFREDMRQKICPGITLVIDMAKTTFLDPTITSIFWEGAIESHKQGAKIITIGMNEQVKLVFERSGLLTHLQ